MYRVKTFNVLLGLSEENILSFLYLKILEVCDVRNSEKCAQPWYYIKVILK